MSQKLKNSQQIHNLANELGYKFCENPVSAILAYCDKKIAEIMTLLPECNSLTQMLELVANRVGTNFEIIESDESLFNVKQHYVRKKEFGFTRLDEYLKDESDLGVTIKLTKQEPWEPPFVSVIDCRGLKANRAYFTKWHEIAHILTLPPNNPCFAVSHNSTTSNEPIEKLMDIIAGRYGFYGQIIQKFTNGQISFETIELLRQQFCPEASFQSAMINMTKFWAAPCILIEAQMALKKDEDLKSIQPGFYFFDAPEPKLRAIHITLSDMARDNDFVIHQNMRIPQKSVITQVFNGNQYYLENTENLCWWESRGKCLAKYPIRVMAKKFGNSVSALIVPNIKKTHNSIH